MVAAERFQAATDKTLDWLKDSGLSAWDGYEIGQVLHQAGVKYTWYLVGKTVGASEREWHEAQAAWLGKLVALGGPESLLASVRAID